MAAIPTVPWPTLVFNHTHPTNDAAMVAELSNTYLSPSNAHRLKEILLGAAMQLRPTHLIVSLLVLILCIRYFSHRFWADSTGHSLHRSLKRPPIVHIAPEEQFSHSVGAAYNKALDEHGDVVIVPRLGLNEYIVAHNHAREVLTDAQHFSFEIGVIEMLFLNFVTWFKEGSFVQDVEKLVQEGVTPRLKAVVEKIAPVFTQKVKALHEQFGEEWQTVRITDVYRWTHEAIARAMVILILGEQYLTDEMTNDFMALVVAVSQLSGMYRNTDCWRRFPGLWSVYTTTKAIFGTIIPVFAFRVAPKVWANRGFHLSQGSSVERNEYAAFFDILAVKHCDQRTGKLSFSNFAWCSIIALGIIFASVHQTAVVAVWCIMSLAQKQDMYLPALRKEWEQHIIRDEHGQPKFSVDVLNRLSLLDSFIREVMRTKGDTMAPVRYAVKDVRVGKYVIPRGAMCMPFVRRCHEHPDNYGESGTKFDGFRWSTEGRPAVQASESFISFGLGRWACPGRYLAIHEIKLILYALFSSVDVRIKAGTFVITDPANTASVAPKGVLEISPLASAV